MNSAALQIPSSNRRGPFQRMVWKEVRQNLPLLVVFVGLMIALIAVLSPGFAQLTEGAYWGEVAWGVLCFYALTQGVFLFAPEKETGTTDLLRQLPVSSGFIVRSKILIALGMLLAFLLIALAVPTYEILVLERGFSPTRWTVSGNNSSWIAPVVVGIALPIDCFLCGILCSLSMKRAIFAALGAFVLVMCVWINPMLIGGLYVDSRYSSGADKAEMFFAIVVALKVICLLGLILAITAQGRSWLGNAPQIGASSHRPVPVSSLAKSHPADRRFSVGRMYRSLLWQTFRQNRFSLICMAAVFVVIVIAGIVHLSTIESYHAPARIYSAYSSFGIFLGLVCLAAGQLTFAADNSNNNYRFFQQHGAGPRKVWLVRQIPAAVLTIASLVAILIGGSLLKASSSLEFAAASWWSVLGLVTAFAIGQFNSMFFRSIVYAIADTLGLCVVLSILFNFLVSKNASMGLFFAPIPVAMFAITWWWAPRWISEQHTRITRCLPHLVLVGFIISLLSGFAFYRFNEIPNPNFSLTGLQAQFDSLDFESTDPNVTKAKLIAQASETIDVDPMLMKNVLSTNYRITDQQLEGLVDFLDSHQYPSELLEEADAVDANIPLLNPESASIRNHQASKIRYLISTEAQVAQFEGELDKALEKWLQLLRFENQYLTDDPTEEKAIEGLIGWCEMPDQTSERLSRAIGMIEFTADQWRNRAEALGHKKQVDFENWLVTYQTRQGGNESNFTVLSLPKYFVPWELERSRRAVHYDIERLVPFHQKYQQLALIPNESIGNDVWTSSMQSSLVNPQNSGYFYFANSRELLAMEIVKVIQESRYAQLRLALAAYRIDHGEYPESLEKLAPNYLKRIPIDVVTGGQFAYSATGEHLSILWDLDRFNGNVNEWGRTIAPNTPFLLPWSLESNRPEPVSDFEVQEPDSSNETLQYHDYTDPNGCLCQQNFQFDFRLKQ